MRIDHSRVINHHPSPSGIIDRRLAAPQRHHPSIIHPSIGIVVIIARTRTYLDEIIVIVHDDGRGGGGGARLLRLTRSH
jgi:hypothetical protein